MPRFSILFCVKDENLDLGAEIDVVSEGIDSAEDHDAVILVCADQARTLRSALSTVAVPIYTTNETLAGTPFVDGLLPDDVAGALEVASKRRNAVLPDLEKVTDTSILEYLWRFETRRLTPNADLSHTSVYSYPLLEALGVTNHLDWVRRAERSGLLQKDEVVDRTRNCAACSSAHLNYVDRCPDCDALDIFPEQALHCFTCGHIAEQGNFRRGERLICPKCETALKHIGTDYDRPIERMRCGNCSHRFNDARVRAACLECGKVNAQADLQTRTYWSYRIGPQGEALLRTGVAPNQKVSEFGDRVGREQFLWSLSWLNTMASADAVLLRIRVNGPEVNNDEDEARERSLRDQIGALLAPMDVLHFQNAETLLALLPQNGEARATEMADRLKTMIDTQVSDQYTLAMEAVTLPLPGITSDARGWLDRYVAQGD